ncbi:AAA family ATPase [Candidatus Woesearchaeota archaeon]|nr:AAA family ATPase [Candidatus Woesearchaeota archaeon]
MVTVDGDVTEVSGAMQGGFRKRTGAGGFKESDVEEDIKKKEGELKDSQNIVQTLEKRKSENEELIERLRTTKANLEGDIIKIEKSLHLEDGDLDADKKTQNDIEQKLEDVTKGLFEIQNKIGILNQGLVDVKVKKQNLRSEINELKNPRLLAELNTFEQKLQQIKEDNVKFEAEINSISSQMDTIISPEVQNIQKIVGQHKKEKEGFETERKELLDKIKIQEKEIKEKEDKQKKFYSQFKELFNKREKLNEEINKIEQKVIRREEEARRHEHKQNSVSLENAKVKAELAGFEEEFKQYEGVKLFRSKPLDEIKKEIGQFERMVQDIGAVNMKALEIYNNVEDEYNKLLDKKKKLSSEREDVLIMMNEVEAKKKELFMNSFDVVNENFGKIFETLSTKGKAFLALEDEKNPFEGGVTINVKLSSRKYMDIRSLSGGEKTLTALAFIFSIQEHEPASFYILDEVDAALDKRNSEKLAELIEAYSKRAQYIMISHNDGVISEADNLYGVSMDKDGISKIVTLKI